jgi:hypothetical protein
MAKSPTLGGGKYYTKDVTANVPMFTFIYLCIIVIVGVCSTLIITPYSE